MHTSRIRKPPHAVTLVSALALLLPVTGLATVSAEPAAPGGSACAPLYALGVQGSDEGVVGADTTSDTGALGQLFAPVTAAAGDLVQHSYVRFGQAQNGGELSYDAAVAEASQQLEQLATDVLRRCPGTRIAAVGYAYGAPAVARFAVRAGAGTSGVTPDQIAAVILLSNPERPTGSPVLPGQPDNDTPSAVPGTNGAHVSTIQLPGTRRSGAGISAASLTTTPVYGALSGRIADLCAAGDATCDSPPGGPFATAVANIAARTDTRDPIAAITTLADALSTTVFTAAVGTVNDDITGTSLDQLSYQPTMSLGQRLALASQADTPRPSSADALAALYKVGTIGLNAVITLARKVITPATIAELATVGMADPLAAVAMLGTKLAAAAVELVPPQTASRWVNEAFDAVTSTITQPGELYAVAGAAQYSTTSGRHGAYRTASATPSGESALSVAAQWLTAAARDLASAASTTASQQPRTSPSVTLPSRPSSRTSTAPSSAPETPSGGTETVGVPASTPLLPGDPPEGPNPARRR